jgi:capsule polysaccharide export protein KpsE/RkpR
MNDYRREVREIGKEVPFTLWTFFKWALGIIVVVAVLVFLAQMLGIISINIEREKVQRSQPYVETKATLLLKLHSDWTQLEAEVVQLRADDSDGNFEIIVAKKAQQKSIIKRMQEEVTRIPEEKIPSSIKEFLDSKKFSY